MPEAVATPAATTAGNSAGSVDPSKLDVLKQAVHEAMRNNGDETHLFSQDEILDFDIIPNRDTQILLKTVQSLSTEKLLVSVQAQGQLFWRWRSKDDAFKYKQCTTDEQYMVYEHIDEAGGDGIWSKLILSRTGLADAVGKAALKQLVNKGLITPFKNVEHPNKKMYIKASMRPSERATGGPWFTDQTLDEAFIEELQRVIFDYVKRQSVHLEKAPSSSGRSAVPKKGILKGSAPAAAGKKRGADDMSGHEEPAKGSQPPAASKPKSMYLPYPAGYKEYPTVRAIARFISDSGIISDTILGEDDIQKLVDVLVYDGLVESVRVGGKYGYRVSRTAKQSLETWAGASKANPDDPDGASIVDKGAPDPYTNGFTEAPCGRCPVFDLCEEGGPVSASNCEYFQRWLGLQ